MQKDNVQSALARADRYLKAVAGVGFAGDDEAFLSSLARCAMSAAGAARAYGILLDGDTVVTESGCSAAGEGWAPEGESRRLAARAATQMLKSKPDEHGPTHTKAAGIETLGDRVLIPFRVEGNTAGAILLEHATAFADGTLTLDLAIALVATAGRTRMLTKTHNGALENARKAEARVRDMEGQIASGGVGGVSILKPMSELERDAIELALRTTGWNKDAAARRLGISRASIYMKVKKLGLQRPV